MEKVISPCGFDCDGCKLKSVTKECVGCLGEGEKYHYCQECKVRKSYFESNSFLKSTE